LQFRATISGKPGSKKGNSRDFMRSIFAASLSTQVTVLPKSAKQAPVTNPTYPVPTTVMSYMDKVLVRVPPAISNRHRGGARPGMLSKEQSRERVEGGILAVNRRIPAFVATSPRLEMAHLPCYRLRRWVHMPDRSRR
jgi:hypothetical protein